MEEIKKMKIGDPLDRSTDHGPQNHKAHLDKLLEYCDVGVKEGATLVYGGRQVDRPGRTHTEHRTQTSVRVCVSVFKPNLLSLSVSSFFYVFMSFSDFLFVMFVAASFLR